MIPADRMEREASVDDLIEPVSTRGLDVCCGDPVDLWAGAGLDRVASAELDARVRDGWEAWCDLLEALVHTDGMLPSRHLAGRLVAFFEDAYWRAEEARVEVIRRQYAATSVADGAAGFREVW